MDLQNPSDEINFDTALDTAEADWKTTCAEFYMHERKSKTFVSAAKCSILILSKT